LLDAKGQKQATRDDAVKLAVRLLNAGNILAIQGLGGFQLMVDATNSAAIERLRERKHRWEKPLAIMVSDLEQAARFTCIDALESALLSSPEAPIVLVEKRAHTMLAPQLAPNNPRLGIMLPSSPLHHLLMQDLGLPVVATSGNLSEEPICISPDEALTRLGTIADFLLVHDRPIERHADDSVLIVSGGYSQILRRARGFAPLPILLQKREPTVLGLGGHLKNTIALSVGDRCFLSQHIGDLDTLETRQTYLRVIEDFLRLYGVRPAAIARDLHDDYVSSQIAEQLTQRGGLLEDVAVIKVQHHHAHLAACLADAGTTEPVLGVVWDGSGLGTNGTIWGGEFLHGNADGFERIASLQPLRLPGGDRSARSPRRIALSFLLQHFSLEWLKEQRLACIELSTDAELQLIQTQLEKQILAPYSSSIGRLFDAVASLLGLRHESSFEGQAAMALEFIADPFAKGSYPLVIEEHTRASARVPSPAPTFGQCTMKPPEELAKGRPDERHFPPTNNTPRFSLDPREMLTQILEDLSNRVDASVISARFHLGLAEAVLSVARKVEVETVALTGGCFQNRLLTERCRSVLSMQGHRVLLHHQVPPNDGGLALGQVAVACSSLARS
jgi:hydrogenase maturation protein HypF